jgi:uncharacterized protein involved in outer membrane biogenesis
MKKKILLGIGIGFVVVVIVVLVVVGFFLGDVIKTGMETVGPKVTQTTLTVDSVKVYPLMGDVSLNSFVLGNPQEYIAKATNCITVGKVAISVKPLSALADKMVVKNIEVRDADIFYVGNPLGANNIKQLQDNVNSFVGTQQAKPADTNAPAKPSEQKPAKKLEVDNILITGAKVHFNGTTLPLPDIHLSNLGTGPDGITPAELFKDVLSEIATGTGKAVVSSLGSAGKAVGDEASKLGKSIGSLFKSDKKTTN